MERKYGKLNGISLKLINFIGIIVSIFFSLFLLITIYLLASSYHSVNDSTLEYTEWEKKASELEKASDYLTDNVRYFVIVHDKKYLDNYFEEIHNNKRRDNAIQCLKDKFENTDAFNTLNSAMEKSNELEQYEYYAMKLVAIAENFDLNSLPDEVKNYKLDKDDLSFTNEEKLDLAIDLVFGEEYEEYKDYIRTNVDECVSKLNEMMIGKINQSTSSLRKILILQQAVILLLIVFLFIYFVLSHIKIVLPLTRGLYSILNDELLSVEGIKEYKYFAMKYNEMRIKENNHNIMLEYAAEHDKLTGLYNRSGYDSYCSSLRIDNLVYILIDIDFFKEINDKYGHEIGDNVLKIVADKLYKYFGKGNYVSRIGGDEFSIIIKDYVDGLYEDIKKIVNDINSELENIGNDYPKTSLSFGVARGTKTDNISSLYIKADKALYETKENGRSNVTFYN